MKNWCRNQFRADRFLLKHQNVWDFYIASWQNGHSTVPLLCFRVLMFLFCLAILVYSMVWMGKTYNFGFYFIYFANWAVIMMTLTSGFAVGVSWMAYRSKGLIDHTTALPWYVKSYWVLYNITVPMAFCITVFYRYFLTLTVEQINLALYVFTHIINSVIMLAVLLTARHPSHLLHFTFPVAFVIVYLVFSVIYYFAGGLDPFGREYIYPKLDWSSPGETGVTAVLLAVGILVFHVLVVGLSRHPRSRPRSRPRPPPRGPPRPPGAAPSPPDAHASPDTHAADGLSTICRTKSQTSEETPSTSRSTQRTLKPTRRNTAPHLTGQDTA